MAESILSQDYLNYLFDYKDGQLYWKNHKYNAYIGKKAGTLNQKGYWQIKFGKKIHKAHRLIFMMHYGYLPKIIDHIDCNPLNNCIKNLREATKRQNLYNRLANKTSKSGIKNVSWCKKDKRWIVQVNKKYIGQYKNLELAELVAQEARDKYHGEYARHN
jgi:hypothetical protein